MDGPGGPISGRGGERIDVTTATDSDYQTSFLENTR